MVRPKRSEQPAMTAVQIKTIARRQMSEQGTAGLSLRGIARELNVTAPAIYNYFPRLDDLITALIADGYNAQADFLEAAAREHAEESPYYKLLAVLLAYRAWAIDHPVDYALLYGNPIPGYQAPTHITASAAQRVFAVILAILNEAHQQGKLKPVEDFRPSPAELQIKMPTEPGASLPDLVVYVGVTGWYHIHGIIMLELFGHLQSLVNDTALYYQHEVQDLIARFLSP